MSSMTKYAGTVTQTTGGSYRTFSDLANVKDGSSSSATSSGNIKGKSSSPNRPSTLTFTNFGFNLPTGAEVTRVSVSFCHRKNKVGDTVCNIQAPVLSWVGVSGLSTKATFAPTMTFADRIYRFTNSKFTRTVINSSSFGVKLDYATNTNEYDGTMSIQWLRITVDYKLSSYAVGLKKVSGGYDGDDYVIQASINNLNLTSYNPTLTLSAPAGFSFKSSTGAGTVTRVNNRTITWNPKLTSKTGSRTVSLVFGTDVTFPSGVDVYTGTFTLVESLNSTTKNHTATIRKKIDEGETPGGDAPPSITDETLETLEFINAAVEEEINILTTDRGGVMFAFPMNGDNEALFLETDTAAKTGYYDDDELILSDLTTYEDSDYNGVDFYSNWQNSLYLFTSPGRYVIEQYEGIQVTPGALGSPYYTTYETYEDITPIGLVYFDIKPKTEDLTEPFFGVLEVGSEEVNRLGDGFTYICQVDMKDTTTDTWMRNWYKNYRVGVFNNNIENVDDYTSLTDAQIISNALYWSEEVAGLNEYNSVECEFTYDDDYPLYIIMTGDYPESSSTYGYDIGTVTFDEPAIIEKSIYQERLGNGNYPEPILDLINYEQSDDSATIILDGHTESNPIRVYDFPVEEGFGTNDNIAIRGIQVRANIESADPQIIYARLINPDGESGQRSLVLDKIDTTVDSTNELVIGGLGDLWGFSTVDMTNLHLWEVEISNSNILSNEESTLNYSDVEITFYFETITHQEITVKVEGEDLAYYGVFLESITIPEGLNTNTAYLTIDGTDNNDAYRQNIKEKTITLAFNIGECDLQTSTDMLRQLTALLVNEKDEYNRPIPNRITFSNYPDDYFEYIMEEALEVSNEVGAYNVQAKLVIPAGTSYTNDEIVTNTIGYVHGLAAVNPIITLQPSDENIEVQETISGQSFSMGYSGDWNTRVVVIDCEDRKVYLRESEDSEDQTDISKYVDFNVDWFRLYGEYQFDGVNCTIRTVSYNERW